MKLNFKFVVIVTFCLLFQTISAQEVNYVLSQDKKQNIVTTIQSHLKTTYVNLEKANKMIKVLNVNLKSKKYKAITNPTEFSKVLTKDLQTSSKDLHLKVNYKPKQVAENRQLSSEDIRLKKEQMKAKKMAEINFGFMETKILRGNIGYLNLCLFADTKYAEETATAAMNFLSNTNAVIIDLRNNKGGVPSMIQLLSSYFFKDNPVLLSNFYERKTNAETQLYTLNINEESKMANKPLYILTSKKTFSAAEAFAYSLKYYNKAIVVGEVTKGGANRTKRITINNQFSISIPYIEAIHPVTKSNWEGVGVQPNIKTSKKDAFARAYLEALNNTIKRNKKSVLNQVGYALLQESKTEDAILIFKANTMSFPEDANTWDSLGEAYVISKQLEKALTAYKKAIALDPNLESAKRMIQKLQSRS
ncbi:S41 family peptidase [Tenacibaculum singaporense]|uniref:S41 family peptidase n=1 Tax=Tenacibaculum singaporense TaxID=2358479 RepID=UPI000F66A790|nr:S41 family peptidase [Tenacibaculum singaporense]RSC93345.1 tetratricopeptide repeat protein [Tenacibaculum singaporense]